MHLESDSYAREAEEVRAKASRRVSEQRLARDPLDVDLLDVAHDVAPSAARDGVGPGATADQLIARFQY